MSQADRALLMGIDHDPTAPSAAEVVERSGVVVDGAVVRGRLRDPHGYLPWIDHHVRDRSPIAVLDRGAALRIEPRTAPIDRATGVPEIRKYRWRYAITGDGRDLGAIQLAPRGIYCAAHRKRAARLGGAGAGCDDCARARADVADVRLDLRGSAARLGILPGLREVILPSGSLLPGSARIATIDVAIDLPIPTWAVVPVFERAREDGWLPGTVRSRGGDGSPTRYFGSNKKTYLRVYDIQACAASRRGGLDPGGPAHARAWGHGTRLEVRLVLPPGARTVDDVLEEIRRAASSISVLDARTVASLSPLRLLLPLIARTRGIARRPVSGDGPIAEILGGNDKISAQELSTALLDFALAQSRVQLSDVLDLHENVLRAEVGRLLA